MFQKIIKNTKIIALTTVFASQAFGFGDIKPVNSTFTVEIQNLTTNQPLTPPVISTSFSKLFQVGEKSSDALRKLAEDGDTSGYEDLVPKGHIGKNVIMPGETKTFYVNKGTNYKPNYLSIVSMLARTNDAFVGISGELIYSPLKRSIFLKPGETKTLFARVYDAGTEANTESCDHIPAPPCNSAKVRVEEGAEGLVLPHTGLNLNADLTAQDKFAQIAAKITITRNL